MNGFELLRKALLRSVFAGWRSRQGWLASPLLWAQALKYKQKLTLLLGRRRRRSKSIAVLCSWSTETTW
jgi:hypothetical protein